MSFRQLHTLSYQKTTSVKISSGNKPLITLGRVVWLDISLSGFIFTLPLARENKLASLL